MESILVGVNIFLAILLVIVILLQRSEGGALGIGVSQDGFTSSRTAGDFLTKIKARTLNIELRVACERLIRPI